MESLATLSAKALLKNLPLACHADLRCLLVPKAIYHLDKFVITSSEKNPPDEGWFLVFAGKKYLGITCHVNSFIFCLYINLANVPDEPCFDVYYIPIREYNDVLEFSNPHQEEEPTRHSQVRLSCYDQPQGESWQVITSIRELRQITQTNLQYWQDWGDEPPVFNIRYWQFSER